MSIEVYLDRGARRFRFRPTRIPPSPIGLFAQTSVIRRVYSDWAVFFGAGRALMLQIAHPSVAAGVADHSDYQHHPLNRLIGTLYATNSVVFGSREQAARIGAIVTRLHEKVTGPGYRAMDPELLCWVNATLADTALNLYQRLVRPLSNRELDEFVADSRRVGEIFGCPIATQPATWQEFRGYCTEMIDSLTVSDTGRQIASSLMRGEGLPARPLWLANLAVNRAVTAALLPDRLRAQFELPWRLPERATAAFVLGAAGVVLSRMPERWRQLGPELLGSPEPRPAPLLRPAHRAPH